MSSERAASQNFRFDTCHEVVHLLRESFRRMQLTEVDAEVRAEEVYLTGTACSWHEKQLAQELARTSAKGLRIRNQINVHSLLN
ncbi:MAG: BON domain-containing protein [Planctomyces sp.]|nr:BON domain-containing protein [Planctomyces sp.]